jgi:hypothetical protein
MGNDRIANGTGKAIVKTGGDSWFFLTADYAFGHSLEKDTSDVVKANGGKVLGQVRLQVLGQVRGQVLGQVRGQVGDQVLGQVSERGDVHVGGLPAGPATVAVGALGVDGDRVAGEDGLVLGLLQHRLTHDVPDQADLCICHGDAFLLRGLRGANLPHYFPNNSHHQLSRPGSPQQTKQQFPTNNETSHYTIYQCQQTTSPHK